MAEHYKLELGVILSIDVKHKVKKIADKYYLSTGKDIVITSGTRTSLSQAEALYGKLEGGDKLTVYKDQSAAKEVKKVYEDAILAKKSRNQIIEDIKTVIDKQIRGHKYLSQHLKQGAVDIRSRDMTITEKNDLKKAATGVAAVVILETIPPHFHLQF
jgi:hypothetical protein